MATRQELPGLIQDATQVTYDALEDIKAAVEKKDISWGSLAELNHINETLSEIARFLNVPGYEE